MMKNEWVIGVAALLCMGSCQSKPTLFERLDASETGIAFTNQLTETETANILAYEYFYNGGGVAVGDFNNDGLPDVYLTGNQVANKLFINQENLHFEDITDQSGAAGRAEAWKTGVTLADVNADGWLDIYVCYSGSFSPEKRKNQLFINLGSKNNGKKEVRFTEQAEAYGIADAGYSTQGLFFDYDTDGDLDLFVLNHNLRGYQRKEAAYLKKEFDANAGDRLYRNDNGNHFTDVTKEAGIISNALGFGLGIATGDVNGDNKPDLYVCNDYVEEDYAYLNNGDGTFSERGKDMMGHFSYSTMGVDIADINNDGLPDIFTTDMLPEDNRRQKLLSWPDNWNVQQAMLENGFHRQNMRNMLQVNQGLTEHGTRNREKGNNLAGPARRGYPLFSEVGQLAGVQATDWSWAGLLADFDNDGRKDLFVSNGFVRDYTDLDFVKYYADEQMNGEGQKSRKSLLEHLQKMPATPTHHYIFKNETTNNNQVQFANKVTEWGFDQATIACGAAYADFDQDGDLDLITCNTNEPTSLYKNQQQEREPQNFVKIKLKGEGTNAFGVGAKVYVYTAGQLQYQEFTPTRGFQACMYDDLHFGLGKINKIDSVRVLWPSNKSQLLTSVALNKTLAIEEKRAVPFDPAWLSPTVKPMFEETDALDFTHLENPSIDFNTQILLPYLYSYGGPRMAKGDVNGDGLDDIYVGGATDQAGQLFLQTKNGDFKPNAQPAFENDKAFEDRDAVFFDADSDRDLDLYVVSGEYDVNYAQLQDRLYLNNGKGVFSRSPMGYIPEIMLNKTCVKAFDADGDGDLDLFLGGGVQTANFPYANESHLLQNDGKGHFIIVQKWDLGLVTDVAVADINKDTSPDLIISAEWKPIQVLENQQKTFALSSIAGVGLWNRIAPADLDGDGDIDFVVGNVGLNTALKATKEQPMTLYYDDFDQNGRLDPFIAYFNQGQSYPLAGRDEALEQLAPLRKNFIDYKSYSTVTAEEVLGKEWSARAQKLIVNELKTGILWNEKGKLTFTPLPLAAQISPVYAILTDDFDGDGKTDILLAGNQSNFRIRIGKTDANQGLMLKGNGKGAFESVPQYQSGLALKGDVRDIQSVGNQFVFGVNNGKVQTFFLNRKMIN